MRRGFTLIEMLVVTAIIGTLAALLLPALMGAKDSAKSVMCQSNLRQLAIAMNAYALHNDDYYPPSSWDVWTTNLHRWHGVRDRQDEPFDFKRSPLYPYLQEDRIKACPAFADHLTGFEAGCGGYGYNDDYVGSGRGIPGDLSDVPAKTSQIANPSETLLLADCAFLDPSTHKLIDYSFITEPVFAAWGNCPTTPSIHFRHRGRANVAWCDGHVSSEPMGFTCPSSIYPGADFPGHHLGYVGKARDNRLYDRQ